MKNDLKISVVIPTKNRENILPTILDSLIKSTYKNFEVVIIDGGSDKGTRKLVGMYSTKLPIKFAVETGGLIKQENKALELAKGDIYLRTDDDAEFSPRTLEEIVKTFRLGENVGGVSGPTITTDMKARDLFAFQEKLQRGNLFWRIVGKFYYDYILEGKVMAIGRFFRSGAVSLGANYPHALSLSSSIEVDMHECTSMAIRTDVLRKIGGFDTLYHGIGDYSEVDVSFKVREMGYKILLNPKAAVYHHVSQSGVFSARTGSYDRISNFIYFYFRHIRPDTLDKMCRFLAYIFFQCGYYTYIFFQTKKIQLLGFIPAIFFGFFRITCRGTLRDYLFKNIG